MITAASTPAGGLASAASAMASMATMVLPAPQGNTISPLPPRAHPS